MKVGDDHAQAGEALAQRLADVLGHKHRAEIARDGVVPAERLCGLVKGQVRLSCRSIQP